MPQGGDGGRSGGSSGTPPAAPPPVPVGTGEPGGQAIALSPDGSSHFSTAQDKKFAAEANALLKRSGSSRADFDALAARYGRANFGSDLDRVIAYRSKGGIGATVGTPVTGYSQARSGMAFAPDKQYIADLQTFRNDLMSGVLNDAQVQQVRTVLNRSVQTRLTAQGGQLAGDAYKQAASEIDKAARKLSGSEPLVADALRDYSSIFDNAARRNSSPAAVEMLDKADAGYAKAVRIEMAAAARGGGTGRFSPTQFDAAVQKASGGVRSRAYLRGDALMGDYAEAGKSLTDRLPNSGTADRLVTKELLTGQGLATAPMAALGYTHPAGAALTGAVTLPYAPGVQRLTRGLLAPSRRAGARTLGDLIKQRGGAVGAPGALLGGQALGLIPSDAP